MQFSFASEQATAAFAGRLTSILQAPFVLYLQGDLGSGKTTFVRALLHALGYRGKVKSPTYTIVEPYRINNIDYYHFDLYRLGSPMELEAIGIQDYLHNDSICLVEWPEKGQGVLPEADLTISLHLDSQTEAIDSRICRLQTENADLQQKIRALQDQIS